MKRRKLSGNLSTRSESHPFSSCPALGPLSPSTRMRQTTKWGVSYSRKTRKANATLSDSGVVPCKGLSATTLLRRRSVSPWCGPFRHYGPIWLSRPSPFTRITMPFDGSSVSSTRRDALRDSACGSPSSTSTSSTRNARLTRKRMLSLVSRRTQKPNSTPRMTSFRCISRKRSIQSKRSMT